LFHYVWFTLARERGEASSEPRKRIKPGTSPP